MIKALWFANAFGVALVSQFPDKGLGTMIAIAWCITWCIWTFDPDWWRNK